MNVFKAYIKLIPSFCPSILLYGMLFAFLLLMTVNSSDEMSINASDFGDFSVSAAIFDEDNSPESKALVKFIEESPNVTVMEVKPENLQDNLFYRRINYALTVNKGYGEGLRSGNTKGIMSSEVISNSTSAAFFDSMLSSYVSCVSLYLKGGYDVDSAVTEAARQLEKGINTKNYQRDNGWNEENRSVYYFFNYMPYILLMMVLQILIPTFVAFMNDDLRSRTLCSPINPVSYTIQVVAGSFMICIGVIVLLCGVGTIITGGKIIDYLLGYSSLQLFVFMLISLAIAVLIGVIFSSSKKSTGYVSSMFSNVLGLGMAFLCGVFVPQSLLGEEILNTGKFLPAYWFVKANNLIMGADNAIYNESEILACIGVQALFAAAIFAVALLVSGLKKGKRSS